MRKIASRGAAIQNMSGFELFPNPPYSPDLAPNDFYLCPFLTELTKGCKFADDKDVICTANGWLEDQDQYSSTMESELWRNAGPSAFQLKGTMLKIDKI